jgi:3alpha(or 20beta)-hydroxysteroid dehydrogenase
VSPSEQEGPFGRLSLTGKVAVVTGGARGQGAAEGRLFVERGARVVLTDVLAEEGRALAAGLGDDAVFMEHDVSDEESWARVVGHTEERFGRLDVLVNNAGIHRVRPLVEERAADLAALLAVNLIGPMIGMRMVAGAMERAGGGSIVNISSLAGLQGIWGHGAYGASKWGLRGVTKTAAVELGPRGIRVNSVHPGPIETAMLPTPPGEVAARFSSLPLGRVGQAAEVAEVVAFLASEAASYLSGAELTVDGGSLAGRRPDDR